MYVACFGSWAGARASPASRISSSSEASFQSVRASSTLMRLPAGAPDEPGIDRSFPTDVLPATPAKPAWPPARPDAGIASDASQHLRKRGAGEDRVAAPRLAVARRRREVVPVERVAVGLEQAHVVLERRAVGVVAAEWRGRLRAPGGEARRDPVAHEVVEPLGGRDDCLVDGGEAERPCHLNTRDEVRDHVPRPEDVGRGEDPAVPLLAADVALLAGRDQREEALVPDLVVRVVDRDAVILEALRVGLRQRLRDHLADPAAGELLLDRLRVTAVEVGLGQAVYGRGDRAARERVGVARPLVVAVDQGERLEHVLDRLHARVRPARLLVLAPVVVDVAELALLLGAEVLAEPQHGEVDEVAPLDRRRGLHHRLAVAELVAVVLGHRRHRDLGQLAAVEREPPALRAARDAVGRVGVDAYRDDRAAELPRAAGEGDLLGGPLRGGRAQLGERLLVEREDEVRLRLHAAVEVVGQRADVERHPGAKQVLLQHRLGRDLRVARAQLLEQLRAGAERGAHAWNLPPHAGRARLYESFTGLRWTVQQAFGTVKRGRAPPSPHRSPAGIARRRAFTVGARRCAGADAEREL